MPRYKNQSGNSGVIAYEIRKDSILVTFAGGDVYEYSYKSTGKENVEAMKALALSGKGLSTFISTRVREKYARKIA